jgi:iron uptake system component EfeO
MSAPDLSARTGGSPRAIRLAVVAAAVLVVAGGAAFYYAVQTARPRAVADVFQVTIAAHGCEPNAISIPAGRRTFEIHNASDRPVEWEILDGVMVVAEQEDIPPGFKATLTADLSPGDLHMTCGLLSNPHGALTVTPSEGPAVAASAPTMRAFLGPLAEYQFYLGMQAMNLSDGAGALADAIKSGDIDAARTAFETARTPYKRLETVAYRFSDLVNRMNPSADYLGGREADPAFTGFQRLAYGLYDKNSLDGLQPFADQLTADAEALKGRLHDAKLQPTDLVGGAARLAGQLASGRIASGEDKYSKADLDDIDADLDSIGKVVDLVTPVVEKSAPDAAKTVRSALAGAQQALAPLTDGDHFKSYDGVDAATRASLAKAFATLADALGKLEPAVQVQG